MKKLFTAMLIVPVCLGADWFYQTNTVEVGGWFVVGGKPISSKSKSWRHFSGEVKSVLSSNVALCEEARYRTVSSGPLLRGAGGALTPAVQNYDPIPGPMHVVLNLRGAVVGKSVWGNGVDVGTTNMGGGMVLPVLDFGIPHTVVRVTSNAVFSVSEIELQQKMITRRVVANQLRNASNGYAYAQYELGLRYTKGDGVEADPSLALHWLRSACTNGHSQASNALKQIAKQP